MVNSNNDGDFYRNTAIEIITAELHLYKTASIASAEEGTITLCIRTIANERSC